MRRSLTTFFCLLGTACFALVVVPDRVPNTNTFWRGLIGVEGGIPNSSNMVVFTTIAAGASAATINAATAACPSNQVVQLSAGNYPNLSGQILLPNSGVVLRGAGMSNTIISFNAISPAYANILIEGPNSYSMIFNGLVDGTANWTSGYSQGTSNITFNAISNLVVGDIVCLDQLNDNISVSTNSYEGCTYCGRAGAQRSQEQWSEVKNISGTTVTIWPPIVMPNWSGSLSPQAFWAHNFNKFSGIENLTAVGDGTTPDTYGANVAYVGAWNCWLKNVEGINPYIANVTPFGAGRIETRHCYFYGTQAAAQLSYGWLGSFASFCLVEDCIFNKVAAPIMRGACSTGDVAGYNYTTNNYYTTAGWMILSAWEHDAHACMSLNEGNYGAGHIGDNIHGSSGYNTDFRNRWRGFEDWTFGGGHSTQPLFVIRACPTNQYWSAIGNVLGEYGVYTNYESVPGAHLSAAIYELGVQNAGYGGAGPADDPVTASTMFRHLNYDVTTSTNGGIVWSSTNSDHVLPLSLYLGNSLPAYFGTLTGFSPSNTNAAAIDPTNIPAGYRFVYGVDPPAGGGGGGGGVAGGPVRTTAGGGTAGGGTW